MLFCTLTAHSGTMWTPQCSQYQPAVSNRMSPAFTADDVYAGGPSPVGARLMEQPRPGRGGALEQRNAFRFVTSRSFVSRLLSRKATSSAPHDGQFCAAHCIVGNSGDRSEPI